MIKRSFLTFVLGLAIFLCSSAAQAAISLQFVPLSQQVGVGTPVTVAIKISGLGDMTAPSLGTFDLDVNFDPTILGFSSVSYGDPTLGDQLGLGSLTETTPGDGFVNLFELSFDLPEDLNALQRGEFILAIVTFDTLASGTSPISFTVNALGDAFGGVLTVDVGSGSVTTVFNCPSGDVDCLINAINMANASGVGAMINLEAGTYALKAVNNDNEFGPNGLPTITSNITVNGANTTVIERAAGAPNFRIFHIASTGALTLDGLTVKGGNSPTIDFGGGGIFNNGGKLLLINSTVSGNRATGGSDPGGDGSGGGGIANSGTATLNNSTIRDNKSTSSGGGIENFGTTATLSLNNSTVSNNMADFDGGGIENSASATLINSTISGNRASRFGGGINNFLASTGPATFTLTHSTINDNTAGLDGGGIENSASATLINSTISGNRASRFGGGIGNFDTVGTPGIINMNNVTITLNTGSGGVSGFFSEADSTVNISNTIIAQNTGGDCEGTFNSRGFNLIGNKRGCSGFVNGVNGDQVGTRSNPINAMLDPLGDNGGFTATHALRSGSPAINAGNETTPGSGGNACEPIDQRGFPRPIDGNDDGTAVCDTGAFEFGMRIVNNFFSKPTRLNQITSPGDISGCPSDFFGKFSFEARFTNTSDSSLSDLVVEVETLTNGNLLQNADGGPGGAGARLTVPKPEVDGFSDGVLSPTESVTLPFVICLKNRDPFDFFVDVLGIVQ